MTKRRVTPRPGARALAALLICSATLLAASCGGGGGGGGGDAPPPPAPTNPQALTAAQLSNALDDTLFGKTQYADGAAADYFGSRNAAGLPVAINRVVVTQAGETSNITLDAQSRPTRIEALSGGVTTLEYLADGRIVLSVVGPDGEQVNTDLAGGTVSKPSRAPAHAPRNEVTLLNHGSPHAVIVDVSSCGTPVTLGNVFVRVGSLGTYDARPAGNGLHIATIPVQPLEQSSISIQAVADAVGGAMAVACGAIEDLPAGGLASACAHPALASATVRSVCVAGAAALEVYCRANQSPNPNVPGLIDRFVTDPLIQRLVERENSANVTLTAFVLGQEDVFPAVSASAPKGGPYPVLPLAANITPRITDLTLSPSAPAAGQGYVATGTLACVAPGLSVTMQVTGTDGYQDLDQYSESAAASSKSYSLGVPGAQSGVSDVVTMSVRNSSSVEIDRRRASLVFN
jgi:hypothetical protein